MQKNVCVHVCILVYILIYKSEKGSVIVKIKIIGIERKEVVAYPKLKLGAAIQDRRKISNFQRLPQSSEITKSLTASNSNFL